MASVYILFSKKINHYYIGSCENVSFRFAQHIQKAFSGSFSAKADDWKLFLTIDNLGYNQARLIEQHIKRMKSRAYIENLKKYPELQIKLIESYP